MVLYQNEEATTSSQFDRAALQSLHVVLWYYQTGVLMSLGIKLAFQKLKDALNMEQNASVIDGADP